MKKTYIFVAIPVIIVIAGIAWYGLSPLFINTVVNDAVPEIVNEEPASNGAVSERIEKKEATSFPVVPTAAYPASGTLRVIENDTETIVRYENYKTINGPDLRVYLATDLQASKYVDLGPIKGTEGNINYTVPEGVSMADYRYVLTWCEDFSVLFNSVDLTPVQ